MATAQTDAPVALTTRPPQIWLDPALGQLQAIQLQDVAIDIRIQGFVASTSIDLTFFNPNRRVLEGELVFPLASGQTITGYALEVEGKLRQGVVVEKQTARVAFEATVRRGIDPGLAELTRGNVFRTRLYPIPANGTKRVAISFDQPLLDVGADFRYLLPLQFTQAIHRFKVHAEAIRAEHAPKVATAGSALSFERVRESFVADLDREDFQPDRELVFDVPKPAVPVTSFAVPDRLEPAWRTFAAQVQSASPSASTATSPIRHITLYYDASGSARTRNRQRELEFLNTWLAQLKNVEVALIAFRNDADPVQSFTVRDGDSAALRKAIEALPLDGGTSYGAIQLDPKSNPDLVMVIGDGLSDFGTHEPGLTRADGVAPRLVVLHAAQTVDSARLLRLARRYSGQVINLLELDPAAALKQINNAQWMLQAIRVVQGECVDLAPAAPQPAGAMFALYGRCRGAAELELQFGGSGGASLKRTVKLGEATVLDPDRGAFVSRLWAVAHIADLENAATPDQSAITELAKRFGVVTANTSMLVLDRIEDYVRYKVEPREPELAQQYRTLLAAQPKDTSGDTQKQQHLAQVLAQWTEFKQWHAARYPWLETLLQPTAELETARWQALGTAKDSRKHQAEARALADQAKALQERWLSDGAQPQSRRAWEDEARKLMLRVDHLRQQRLAVAPESDSVTTLLRVSTNAAPMEAAEAEPSVVFDEAMPEAETAAPPPPPSPRGASSPDATAPAGGANNTETVTTVGSRVRRSEVETSQAVLSAAKTSVEEDAAVTAVPMSTAIEMQEWNPNTPYMARLRAAQDPYAAYLRERESLATTPAFFLDCADYFRSEGKNPRIALRVLSNLAEIDFESAPLLRVLAYRLQQWDRFDLAVPLFDEVLKLRGEEPQSRRDLALALSRQPAADYRRAVDLLWDIVSTTWDGRFPEIETIALHELNDVLARMPASDRLLLVPELARLGIDQRLLEPVVVDLRVVLSWDADDTDIDLWVIDPTGEVAIYSAPRTRSGGHLTRDFTQGYGPEVFTIRRALPGTYVVKAHYFGNHQQKLTGAVTAQVEFLTQFDSGESQRQAVTRRLEGDKEEIEIGRFTVGAD